MMGERALTLVAISLVVTLSGCPSATAPKESSGILGRSAVLADGGEVVSYDTLIGDTGVTFAAKDGGWFSYLSTDGRKVVKVIHTGVVKELTWRKNDSGEFCQQMFRTGKESCAETLIIKDKNGGYNSYNAKTGKPGLPFTVQSGNTEGL